MDMIYLGKRIGGDLKENPRETNGMCWFTLEEVEKFQPDEEIYTETRNVIRTLLKPELQEAR